jgi:hypothetical protein
MEYNPLVTLNPTDKDLTLNSSKWIASRIAPGKGNELISFADNKIQNNAVARTCLNSDLLTTALLGMNNADNIVNLESYATSLLWQGIWIINNQPVIGRCHSNYGLVAPLNTFNAGYRYKKGWRPSRVN